MVTSYELIEVLNFETPKDKIVFVNDLIDTINDNPRQFTNRLSNEIEELYEEYCPRCGESLYMQIHKEKREYQGKIVTEDIYEYVCENNCR